MSFDFQQFLTSEKAAFQAVSAKLPAQQKIALNTALTNLKKIEKPQTTLKTTKPTFKLPAGQNLVTDGRLPIGGTILQLGEFQFASGRANLDSLERNTEYRWAQQDRLSRTPAQQFIGQGSDTITLSGLMATAYQQDSDSLATLRSLAQTGKPYLLVSGFGKVYGQWVIKSIKHTATELDNSGRAGWIEFSLNLAAYGEDK